jgi:O-acetyl-ADP-ribose deacetylase (regulator of RNase III)
MKLAEDYGVKSIAFPCISTGIYHFPFERACEIALRAIRSFDGHTTISYVFLVCHSEKDYSIYQDKYEKFTGLF